MNLMYVKISCSVKFLLPGMRPFFLESRGVVALTLDSPAGVVIFFLRVWFFFSYFFFFFGDVDVDVDGGGFLTPGCLL